MPLTNGFRNRISWQEHYQKHQSEFDDIDDEEYLRLADSFLGSPLGDEVHEGTRSNGDIVRYNPNTEEFGIITQNKTIVTYYIPDPWNKTKYPTNMEYYREQLNR